MNDQSQQVQVHSFNVVLTIEDFNDIRNALINSTQLTAKASNLIIVRLNTAYNEAVKELQRHELPEKQETT